MARIASMSALRGAGAAEETAEELEMEDGAAAALGGGGGGGTAEPKSRTETGGGGGIEEPKPPIGIGGGGGIANARGISADRDSKAAPFLRFAAG